MKNTFKNEKKKNKHRIILNLSPTTNFPCAFFNKLKTNCSKKEEELQKTNTNEKKQLILSVNLFHNYLTIFDWFMFVLRTYVCRNPLELSLTTYIY